MQSAAVTSYRYAVFSFKVDDAGAVTVPIGVALWSEERPWFGLRLVDANERLSRFNAHHHFPFVDLMQNKLEQWIQAERLPYASASMSPHQTVWWQQLRELLIHQIRLSEPRPIDCKDPDEEIEALYEAVVSPNRTAKEQRTRVDGAITRCLNDLATRFKKNKPVPGFHGREVKVLRSFRGPGGWVVIEGVNLATHLADNQSDAVVSRLLRVKEGVGTETCKALVGYVSSPEGLNGEQVLVDWIEKATGAKTFDLVRQRTEFRHEAGNMLAETNFLPFK